MYVMLSDFICYVIVCYSPTAESFGVSAQIGSTMVRGGPEVRFHEGSTGLPRGFHEVARAAGWYEPLLGISLELMLCYVMYAYMFVF